MCRYDGVIFMPHEGGKTGCVRKDEPPKRGVVGIGNEEMCRRLSARVSEAEKKHQAFSDGIYQGVGVDLGQQTLSQLKRWGVSDATLARIQPYIGKKQGEALRALRNAPLTLTPDETAELTAAEHRGYMDDVVVPWWDRRAPSRPFASLPWQAQCVLFSLTYQCGTKGAERRGPVTISAMRRGDWRKASAALRDRNGWKGEYVGRRYQEGTLLMEVC